MPVDFETALEPSPEVLFRELKGESVLLDLSGQFYYGLNDVGTRVWQLLDEHGNLGDVYDRLLEEYNVEPGVLRSDIERISGELVDAGLVRIKEEGVSNKE